MGYHKSMNNILMITNQLDIEILMGIFPGVNVFKKMWKIHWETCSEIYVYIYIYTYIYIWWIFHIYVSSQESM